jgi:uncharacterized protein (UPF0335 family)
MSDAERINSLERRADRLEDKVDKTLGKIFEKLDELSAIVAKQACPSPGACVSLSNELQHVVAAHNATMLRVERLEIELIKLNQQKAWVIGAWSAIAFFSSVVGAIVAFIISKVW